MEKSRLEGVTINYVISFREILTLDDGGIVGLDWGVPGDSMPSSREVLARKDTPVLLILAGITGCSMDNYMLHLVDNGLRQGYRPVAFNQRGNGGIKLKVSSKQLFWKLCKQKSSVSSVSVIRRYPFVN